MKKNTLIVLILIVLILTLGAAAVLGYLWYQDNHLFVEDAVYPLNSESLDLRGQDISFAHYDTVHQNMPQCYVVWDVPFQGGKVASDSSRISVSTLSQEDLDILYRYFPNLTELVAGGNADYALLEQFQSQMPGCAVTYQVRLGGISVDPDVAELTLEPADFDLETLKENLPHLHQLTDVTLKATTLTAEQLQQLQEEFDTVTFQATISLLGQEYDSQTTQLDLSGITGEAVDEVCQKIAMLPQLESIELMDDAGTCQLDTTQVQQLKNAAPNAKVHYTFDFYGTTLSTTDEEVKLHSVKFGENGADDLRAALSLMDGCSRFVVEYSNLSNDTLAQIRDEYRDQTKLVWRVQFGGGSCLTDAEVIRCTYDLRDSNSHNLYYCEDVRFVDVGHNEWITDVSFVGGMTNLEVIIISGSMAKDLTAFANCKKLRVLEAAFCEYIEDITPLAQCESLEMVNISYSHVTDLSPLDDLEKLTNVCAMYAGKSRVPVEEQQRFDAANPGCETHYVGSQPYGSCWRYEPEDEKTKRPWYEEIGVAFRYPKSPNNTGWYLD